MEVDNDIVEEDGDIHCCNGSLCRMPTATVLGPADTYHCYNCKKGCTVAYFVLYLRMRMSTVVKCIARSVVVQVIQLFRIAQLIFNSLQIITAVDLSRWRAIISHRIRIIVKKNAYLLS